MSAKGASAAARTLKKGPKIEVVKPRRWNIFPGDLVEVVDGPHDLGKQGKVIRMVPEKLQLIVQGVREITRRVASQQGSQGGTITRELPIHYSNVALVDPITKGPTKVKWMRDEEGNLVRIARTSGTIVPKPEFWLEKMSKRVDGAQDTTETDVLRATYRPTPKTFNENILGTLKQQIIKNAIEKNA